MRSILQFPYRCNECGIRFHARPWPAVVAIGLTSFAAACYTALGTDLLHHTWHWSVYFLSLFGLVGD